MNQVLIVILAVFSFYLFVRALVAFWDKFFLSKAEEIIVKLIDDSDTKNSIANFGKTNKTDNIDNKKNRGNQKQNEINGAEFNNEFQQENTNKFDEDEQFIDDKKIVGVALKDKIKGKHTEQFVNKFAQKLSGLDLEEVQKSGIHVAEEKARQGATWGAGQGR